MSEAIFEQLDEAQQASGGAAAIERLIETLRGEQNFHKLFDALLLKKKFELGVPGVKPTSFDDVPEHKQDEFRDHYVSCARDIGTLFLEAGNIPQAWIYFGTIREPAKVEAALEALTPKADFDESLEELINVALYEGANPVKGLELMLKSHGTCNTITAMDQSMPNMNPSQRERAAAMLVETLYEDLSYTLKSEVEQRMALAPPGDSIRELIAGRDWLFAESNYHIDVSHLNSVVRFARALSAGSPALGKVTELAEYGSKLDAQFQYGSEPPFDDFYPAHIQFFNALAGQHVDDALAYFREKLDADPDLEDKQMVAYVMVDLLTRIGRTDAAFELAREFLKSIEEPTFSFADLCLEAGRMDALREVSRENGDLVSYTAALVQA
ncbi:MAG: hypothetical protein O3A00_17555 [Planctomycetota bacterium]|nr:hypothetical protein [Planctomycetota bacterium]